MTCGYVEDSVRAFRAFAARWRPGPPRYRWLFGIWGDRRSQHEMHAYCCDECGFVELYVLDRWPVDKAPEA
jgi:hypothetical protein